jgi:hypothetical protein
VVGAFPTSVRRNVIAEKKRADAGYETLTTFGKDRLDHSDRQPAPGREWLVREGYGEQPWP